MDIDKIFKLPPARPGAGIKRKLPDLPNEEILKRFRQEGPPALNNAQQAATVEDEDLSAGRSSVTLWTLITEERFGPREGQAEDAEDDEGRFFGGGLNEEQNVRSAVPKTL